MDQFLNKPINVELLRHRIEERGISSKELAEVIKFNPGTLSNLVAGHTYPSYILLNRIYHKLDLSPEDFTRIFLSTPA